MYNNVKLRIHVLDHVTTQINYKHAKRFFFQLVIIRLFGPGRFMG